MRRVPAARSPLQPVFWQFRRWVAGRDGGERRVVQGRVSRLIAWLDTRRGVADDNFGLGPHFSERQYEFAVSFELANALGLLPVIPSTNQEAKEGWDAKFNLGTGWIYHLQYKVPSYASRRTIKNPAQWAFHGGPYYRFSLLESKTRLCAQHKRLIDLRASEPGVYCCAPLFYEDADFWTKASASTVWTDSALLDVNDFVPASFVGPHALTYDEAGTANIWSEEGEGSQRNRAFSTRHDRPPRQITEDSIRELTLTMIEVVARDPEVLPVVPRAGDRGVRESVFEARRPLRENERHPEVSADPERLEEAWYDIDSAEDREATRAAIWELEPDEIAATIARLGALDFGVATYIEPA